MTTHLKTTKETRLILRAYLLPTSVPVQAEVLIFKDSLLHVAYRYLLHEHAEEQAPAWRPSCCFWSRLLPCGAGEWTACSDTACFLDELKEVDESNSSSLAEDFFALHPHPFLLEEQSQPCFLETPFAYPSQVLSVSSLVSSTTI